MCKNKIFVLTAVHNDLKDTKEFLRSIYRQKFESFEVFLVNDGSSDGTEEFIKRNYPQVKLISGNGNLWWTGSLNLGLKKILKVAKAKDLIWIVNNDCFFNETVLDNIYRSSQKNPQSLIGSTVLDIRTKKVWDNGVKIDWKNLRFSSGGNDALSTKGTLYPMRVFKEVGLFDDKHFPHYFSDYEYAIRAKRHGYTLVVSRDAIIFNRTKRTGMGSKLKGKMSYPQLFRSLFSRRSKVNIIDHFNIIRFVCPERYKFKNYLFLIGKTVYYAVHVFPFYYLYFPFRSFINKSYGS